jgi:predicted pyridoxine 5'-phosphate oxidase superfamily flavin-nucleotide-binding protein
MATLTEEMKELIGRADFCNAATANRQGVPNVSPKGSILWIDDETIAFCDWGSFHTRENLKENPKIAVIIVDAAKGQLPSFVQFKGTADLVSSGDRYREVADKARAKVKERTGQAFPDPANVVMVRLEEIFVFPPPRKK